jgi:hypothetical protein
MSNFKLQPVGAYTYETSKKTGKPQIRIGLDKEQLDKVKEWDFDKFYIYAPNKGGGQILGLIEVANK